MKLCKLWWILDIFVSSFCVPYVEHKWSVWRLVGRVSSECRLWDKKWTRNVLISWSGQSRSSEDRRSRIARHSGLFCNFLFFRRFTKHPPASFLISFDQRTALELNKESSLYQSYLSELKVVRPNVSLVGTERRWWKNFGWVVTWKWLVVFIVRKRVF